MNTINFAENCHAIEFQIPRKGRNKEIRGVADAAGVIIEKSRKLWSIYQQQSSTCCLLHFGLIQRRMWSSNNATTEAHCVKGPFLVQKLQIREKLPKWSISIFGSKLTVFSGKKSKLI